MACVVSDVSQPTKWTEHRIIRRLVGGEGSAFPFRRNICVPNVSWGFGLGYEADLLVASPAGWLKEIEVKVTLSDLKADAQKQKHAIWEKPFNKVCELYYAMPEKLWERVKENPPIPDYAGVILVHDVNVVACHSYARPAKRRATAPKLTQQDLMDLMRLGVMRYWSGYKY